MQKLKFQYQRPVKIDPNDGIRKRYPHMRNAYFKSSVHIQNVVSIFSFDRI